MAVNGTAARERLEDAGVKIGGARKDAFGSGMTSAQLVALSDTEKVELVVKDVVWPRPDYVALVASGVDPVAAALAKILRDGIAPSPRKDSRVPFQTSIADYVAVVSAGRDALAGAATVAAVIEGAARAFAFAKAFSDPAQEKARYAPCLAVMKGRSFPFQTGVALDEARSIAAGGFPGPFPAWRRKVCACYLREVPRLWAIWDPTVDSDLMPNVHPDAEPAWAWYLANEDAARAATDARHGRPPTLSRGAPPKAPRDGVPALPRERPDPERPHLERVGREGPDRRGGAVSADGFLAAFGFRAVEFGEWLSQPERQEALDRAFDAFGDLADVLGWEAADLSLGGRLAVAFGARGRGGAAKAHYEPALHVLNMTKVNGAGSLAHEWGHAFDHRLGLVGAVGELEGRRARFASGGHEWRGSRGAALPLLPADAVAVLDEVMASLRSLQRHVDPRAFVDWPCVLRAPALAALRPGDVAAAASVGPSRVEAEAALREVVARMGAVARLDPSDPALDGLRAERVRLMRLAQAAGRPVATAPVPSRRLLDPRIPDDPSGRPIVLSETRFWDEARDAGGYWARPLELFARAFESRVHDWLAGRGRSSQFLVHGVEAGLYASGAFRLDPYPGVDERAAFAPRIDALAARSRACVLTR